VTPDRPLRTVGVGALALDAGGTLDDVAVAFHDDGPTDAPVVVVLHGLTGDADAAGGWWSRVIGPGLGVDTTRVRVLAPNLLGSCYGTTGPSTRPGFPAIGTRDQARAVWAWLEAIGIGRVAAVVGVSLGGMVAQEVGVLAPARVGRVVSIGAPAAQTAWAIALADAQRAALDAARDDASGLYAARRIAMIGYRAEGALEGRFGRRRGADDFAVAEWLAHHGRQLAARFDVPTYRALLGAMDAHDVGHGRGGVAAALAPIADRLVGVGITSDVLYSADVVRAWTVEAGATYRELEAPHGHDAFLIEQDAVGRLLQAELEVATRGAAREVAA
jgi:homoserine O-acetyltransferase